MPKFREHFRGSLYFCQIFPDIDLNLNRKVTLRSVKDKINDLPKNDLNSAKMDNY